MSEPKLWNTIKIYAEHYGIVLDKDDPYESRVKVALRLDQEGDYVEAVEVMVGESMDDSPLVQMMSQTRAMMNLATSLRSPIDIKSFY